jgi:hypothetical protein
VQQYRRFNDGNGDVKGMASSAGHSEHLGGGSRATTARGGPRSRGLDAGMQQQQQQQVQGQDQGQGQGQGQGAPRYQFLRKHSRAPASPVLLRAYGFDPAVSQGYPRPDTRDLSALYGDQRNNGGSGFGDGGFGDSDGQFGPRPASSGGMGMGAGAGAGAGYQQPYVLSQAPATVRSGGGAGGGYYLPAVPVGDRGGGGASEYASGSQTARDSRGGQYNEQYRGSAGGGRAGGWDSRFGVQAALGRKQGHLARAQNRTADRHFGGDF